MGFLFSTWSMYGLIERSKYIVESQYTTTSPSGNWFITFRIRNGFHAHHPKPREFSKWFGYVSMSHSISFFSNTRNSSKFPVVKAEWRRTAAEPRYCSVPKVMPTIVITIIQ
ncbi:hypothetical protein AR158_C149L [Paramecium bursaria Chlorella virus AR158]|uniref:hypothetical protein n=1 Tax=Paramecium bursaria Chlorella virus AR158 TaxID=380598 RepID=UPI00015AA80D|nr:hypothetical protein AR158_C149L [Paramecium bursaria Chlorella virus AR158]ABU43695.1 hypothetical protein AR158_C149L [Paramecium bursaria Chlorella virus AR158]